MRGEVLSAGSVRRRFRICVHKICKEESTMKKHLICLVSLSTVFLCAFLSLFYFIHTVAFGAGFRASMFITEYMLNIYILISVTVIFLFLFIVNHYRSKKNTAK